MYFPRVNEVHKGRKQGPHLSCAFSMLVRMALAAAMWCFQSGFRFSDIDQCPELLVMTGHITVSMPEGTVAASSLLASFLDELECNSWLYKLQV